MARFLVLVAVCLLPVVANALLENNPFLLIGGTYCDTCRVGFQTYASKKLVGAIVKCECRKRDNSDTITYEQTAVTDSKGEYKMLVDRDLGDDVCDVILIKSPDEQCASPDAGRDRARVCLTKNNGMSTNFRYANWMGFLQNRPLAECPKILQQYQEVDTSV